MYYYKVITCVVIFGMLVTASSGCKILMDDAEMTFLHHEVQEDHPVDKPLPGSFIILRGTREHVLPQLISESSSDTSAAAEYIEAVTNNEASQIDFYLRKPLEEFRKEYWKPYLELEFTLSCSNDPTIYTYILTIKDDNLYGPVINNETGIHYGVLTYSVIDGMEIKFNYTENKPTNRIRVSDQDFSLKHANLTATCVGSDCHFFEFSCKHVDFNMGNNYDIEVKFKADSLRTKNLTDGQTLTFELVVNDTIHTANTTVNLIFSQKDALPPGGKESSSSFLVAMLVGGATLLILISCSGIVVYQTMRNRKAKYLLRKLTEAEIREFLEGTANFSGNDVKRSVDVNTPIMALPYNKAFEIPREKLRIDETTILGTGAFGIVWKGSIIFSNGDGITVAVKSVKRNVGVLYFKALLSELKIMAYLGKHPNIVSLVGACTHNIRKREVYIAVQYCANGNFHNYLKCRRDRFSNLVVDGNLQLTHSAAQSYMYSSKGCFSKSISTMDLLKWATQIANGLQYLESLGVIHGDLATRNVLLDSERIAKIGDFGLSRRLIDYSNYYYTKTTQAPLPWKWMAPESLKDMKFSKKSDIWSFGIVLWEIFTLGQTPYPGLNWDETFLKRLEEGMKPSQPAFASNKIYEIMLDTWTLEPHDRPAVIDIKRAIENIMDSALRQKGDMSYMRFLGDQPFLTMTREDEDGYLVPNGARRSSYIDA